MTARAATSRPVDKLVPELTERIKSQPATDAPFVLESRVPQTRTRHVVVVWDAWSDLDPTQRSRIIMDAYDRAGVLGHDSISVAMGITEREALDLNYLPYSVVAHHRRSDPVSPATLRKALKRAGGVQVRHGSLLEVRFPTRESAEEAYRRLQEQQPGPWWGIKEEVAA